MRSLLISGRHRPGRFTPGAGRSLCCPGYPGSVSDLVRVLRLVRTYSLERVDPSHTRLRFVLSSGLSSTPKTRKGLVPAGHPELLNLRGFQVVPTGGFEPPAKGL